jgi:hypothetical protein
MNDADDAELESAIEGGWREVARIDAAYRRGDLDQDGWHAAMLALVEPVYLAAETVELGSGHHGSPEEWRRTRGMVMEAIDRDGTFLDVGSANGPLMESVHDWAAERDLRVEPYGVEISARLADLARRRYPQWAGRIWTANAAAWTPPERWDFVRTGLEYVPADSQQRFVGHLLDHVVAPGGRLIVGKNNERASGRSIGRPTRLGLRRRGGDPPSARASGRGAHSLLDRPAVAGLTDALSVSR